MRLAFLGTPDMAVPPLRALAATGHEMTLVVTRPDRRRGRGAATSPSPVKAAATELGLPVSHDVADVIDSGAELGVVVAFGQIIPAAVLDAVPMVNLHFSLLPRWRGAAPVERVLLAGDATTGVCVMAVERTLDTGAVYAVREVPIGPRATAAELRTQLVAIGTDLLVSTLAGPLPEPVDQRGEITYAAKIDPAELELTWTDPAERLDRLVRVGDAWTMFHGRRLKVLASELCPAGGGSPGELVDVAGGVVGTGDGALALVEVQPEGRSAMTWTAFANGAHPRAGERLG